ncbi:TetR/AcrR family transcriptional regulator [Microtetraspora malaysiensis]|uniref:TetR/AcrR family transcriptional regulator n=1 Tax=Microtetraspora malaysiensis TaxID=161358 RepID=A0ABW6T676_9ACTN
MAVSARRGSPLSPEEIHAEALRLIDEHGVEALSMRKLAAALNVNPMSLYHHVPNKEALLDGVRNLVLSEIKPTDDDGSSWQEQVRVLGAGLRALAHRHPSLYPYLCAHPQLMRQDAVAGVLFRALTAAGVPAERMAAVRNALFAFTAGFLVAEINGVFPRDDDAYEEAVTLIVNGLSAYGKDGSGAARG